jgi:hypothetical protein
MKIWTVIAAAIALAPPLHAHRLEGLLQASLVEVLPAQIGVEVRLLPGVNVAPQIVSFLDTNGDGKFSDVESAAWSADFMARQRVTMDGKNLPLKLISMRTSPLAEMGDGHAEIAVHFTADAGDLASGPRTIICTNHYQPITSSYQTNGLVPKAPGVSIHNHRQDTAQQELTLSAEFSSPPAPAATATQPAGNRTSIWWLTGLCLVGASAAVAFRRKGS